MVVEKGYKQTEVGVIPEEWEVKELNSVGQIFTGTTPSTFDKSNYGGEYFFVSPADLGKEKYIRDTEKKLSEKGFGLSRRFPKNAVLYTCIGSTIGKSGISNSELSSNQQINAIVTEPQKAYFEYIYYILHFFSAIIRSFAVEQAVPLINKTQFGLVLLPIPPLPEQTAIATALSDMDALIAQTEQLIEKKKAIKQGAMQELLTGRTRLKGFGKYPAFQQLTNEIPKGYKQTEVGVIPEEWEVFSLGSISKSIASGKSQTTHHSLGSHLIYGSTGIIGSSVKFDYSGKKILVARVGANAGSLNIVSGEYNVSDNTLIVDVCKNFNLNFIFYYLKRLNLNHFVFGSGQPLITGTQLKHINLPLPPLPEQTAIATALSDMDAEIQTLASKLQKLKHQKQGMMQALLTGKIRLV